MKAVRVHETGGPEVMTLEEVATPEPAAGQVIVKLSSIGRQLHRHLPARRPIPDAPAIYTRPRGGR